jgi:deazaflavin-dependent oxidoreductase (nitroreductase family)
MAKTFRPNFGIRLGNWFATRAVRAGLKIGIIYLLTVRGRKSGQPRTTPVAILEQNGQRYLIAAYGIVDWVRNLRAAGGGTLTRGRRDEAITVVELAPEEAALILKKNIWAGPSFLRQYFDVTPDSSLQEYAREAVRHPVFQVHRAA